MAAAGGSWRALAVADATRTALKSVGSRFDFESAHHVDRLGSSRLSFHHERHTDAHMREHVDQCVDAEQVDFAAYHIADARLRDAEQCGGSSLREPPCLEHLANLDHERRPQPQMLRLLPVKPEIAEHIS